MLKTLKIPSDFFELEYINDLPDSAIILYLKLLIKLYKEDRKGKLEFFNYEITDEVLSTILRSKNISENIDLLIDRGLVIRKKKYVKVNRPWLDSRDRNTPEYILWRAEVFQRDEYKCMVCGTKEKLQAHHIIHWKDDVSKRYDISNGITLCRECHLKAHGGSWR